MEEIHGVSAGHVGRQLDFMYTVMGGPYFNSFLKMLNRKDNPCFPKMTENT